MALLLYKIYLTEYKRGRFKLRFLSVIVHKGFQYNYWIVLKFLPLFIDLSIFGLKCVHGFYRIFHQG